MKRIVALCTLMTILAGESKAAIQAACIADHVWTVHYIQTFYDLEGSERRNSQRRFRFSNDKIYLKDQGEDEYFYGDLRHISPTRFQSGTDDDMTIIFDANIETAFITIVSDAYTTIYSARCIAN